MRRETKSCKCPRCAPEGTEKYPNGYAIFKLCYEIDEETGRGRYVWKCNNCHFKKKCRVTNDLVTPTARMTEIINKISEAFGGTLTIEMHGRRAWIVLRNDDRKDGCIAYGNVYTNGKFRITFSYTWLDTEHIIDDWIAVKIWFAEGRK